MSAIENTLGLDEALQACSQEPIHIPGRVQPHGVLLALQEPDLAIQQVSASLETLTGRRPEELLGCSLEELLGEEQTSRLRRLLQSPDLAAANPVAFTLPGGEGETRRFDGIIHRTRQALILELEPASRSAGVPFESFYHLVNASVQRLQNAPDLERLLEIAAEEVRELTGFDRVMVYRFDPEWNGEVIAEERAEDLEPFLGLRYPASDIPAQARQLYTISRMRLIADVQARPASLVPERTADGSPLDLSFSVLRSVSPVHLEYLKNMGVGASMSVSLMRGERLWGLIACHHRTARLVPYVRRIACDFLGQVLSLQLSVRETERALRERLRLEGVAARLIGSAASGPDLLEGLAAAPEELLGAVNAAGAALSYGDQVRLVGQTPDSDSVWTLVRSLERAGVPDLHATDSLSRDYPEAERWKDLASGLLTARISDEFRVLWFRPEVVRVVNWAGEPQKAVRVEEGRTTLHPRRSFELWKQVVSLRSEPWTPEELEVAGRLRGELVDLFLREAEARAHADLEKLNQELRRSNEELDAFTYIVSHDLKEPLRGLDNYARFVLEDYGELLPEDGRSKLETISELGQRAQMLIDGLLRFSRVGRTEITYQRVPLQLPLDDVLTLLRPLLEESGAEVRVVSPLPVVRAERTRVGEVFNNLITNAVKYNESGHPVIEIGAVESGEEGAPPVIFVRDNGIGIRERDYESVFRMFRRLHTRHRYGGGTGAGLAIARRIVERHGGRIWVESTLGQGTTFYFTLAPDPTGEAERA